MGRMTVKQVMELTPLELNRMTEQQLRQVIKPVADAANKRIDRLEMSGYPSAAKYPKGGFRYSKNMNLNQLRSVMADVRKFMDPQLKTNTLAGAKRVYYSEANKAGFYSPEQIEAARKKAQRIKKPKKRKEALQAVRKMRSGETKRAKKTMQNIFKAFRKLEELEPLIFYSYGYQSVLQSAIEQSKQGNENVNKIIQAVQAEYEQKYRAPYNQSEEEQPMESPWFYDEEEEE